MHVASNPKRDSIPHGYTQQTYLNRIRDYKQLSEKVFVITRIIMVEVGVISWSRRLRLKTLTKALIILNIKKLNLKIVLLYIEGKKKMEVMFFYFTESK